MMGRTHAATGVLAGLLLGPAIGLQGLAEIGPFAATCAGYALLPDLDHPSSTITASSARSPAASRLGCGRCPARCTGPPKGPGTNSATAPTGTPPTPCCSPW
nr:metal-dependent hydrolase [Amycolatopsis roodepoortensis]